MEAYERRTDNAGLEQLAWRAREAGFRIETDRHQLRDVLVVLKVNGLSVEETARATSSKVGAVKQKAHRAYERLRSLLQQKPTAGVAPKKRNLYGFNPE